MKARVLTALALIPPVLTAIFLTTPWPLVGLGVVALWLAYPEAGLMLEGKPYRVPVIGSLLLAAAATALAGYLPLRQEVPVALLGLNVIGVIFAWYQGRLWKGLWALEVSSLWIAIPLVSLLLLHSVGQPKGVPFAWGSPVLMSLLPLWAGDTAAIFVGRWIGKHPLAPSISPKKTVEGGAANLIFCVLVALGLGALIGISWPASLACGVAAGVLGQAGDLFESALKRRSGMKDSGALLPGHGGLLDRIDSVLFTATPVMAILWFFPPLAAS